MPNYFQRLEQLGVPPLRDDPSVRRWDTILKHHLSHIFATILPDGPYDFLHFEQLHTVAFACEGEITRFHRITEYPGTESPEIWLSNIFHIVLECYADAWGRKHANNPDAPAKIPESCVEHLRKYLPFTVLARSIRRSIMDDRTMRAGSTGEEEWKKEKILGKEDPVDIFIAKMRAKSQKTLVVPVVW